MSSNAESTEQIQMMFRSATYLSEDKGEDGKGLGTFTPRLKFNLPDPDNKGSFIDQDMPVKEALIKIRDAEMHKNLFKHGATGGTGQQGSSGSQGSASSSSPPDREKFSDDQAYSVAYQKWRSEYNLDGTKRESSS